MRARTGEAARGVRWALALALCTAFACGDDAREPVPPRRPNLLLFSIDTLRADHLSAYGYARETSPSIDALARAGVLFEHAYSHSPKTAPSHMSIMTGLYPEAHGVVQHGFPDTTRLPARIPTLATLLSRAGYRCFAITAGGNVAPELGFDQGMEAFELIDPPRVAFARALDRMRELSGGGARSPYFLFVHTFEVHSPYAPSRAYAERWTDPAYAGRIASSREELDLRVGDAGADWEARHALFFDGVDRDDPRDVARLVDLYDASIRETDDLLGDLLRAARSEGLLDDTIVVLLSDHGEEFMEHGRLLHSQLYRELLHVPLVVALPGDAGARLAGTRVAATVRLVDVAPTLLDWLDVPVPAHMQGASLVPLVDGASAPEPLVASSFAREGTRSLRLGVWKLVERDRHGGTVRELYDVARDPDERRDVAAGKSDVADVLHRRLSELEAESRALFDARSRGRRVTASPETRARLRALGYAEDAR